MNTLTSALHYRSEVEQRFPRVPLDEQQAREQSLLARVRQGDHEARNDLILALQHSVFHIAARYCQCGRYPDWDSWLDLVQAANVEMLEAVDRALEKHDPCAFLVGVARMAMRQWIAGQDLIAHHHASEPISTVSLDAPLNENGLHLADLLSSETRLDTQEEPEPDYSLLYQTIASLPEKQQAVICRHYFLLESLNAIGTSLTKRAAKRPSIAYHQHKSALISMRQRLEPVYA